MAITSFSVKCPCSKCKGEKFQNLVLISKGQWVCPESLEHIKIETKEKK